jgi:oxygen-independent coproporphyrinogen-3 oxidase
MSAQKLLNVDEMPTTDEKLSMLLEGIAHFTGNGFRFIGMDHFSRRDEELSQAMENDSLQRNFQGYSTLAGADLYGFGMSAISIVGNRYWQNSKEMNEYYRLLEKNTLPVKRLLHLCKDDLVRKDAIMRIMCRRSLNRSEMEEKWGIEFEAYFGDALENLVELERDGLVIINSNEIVITEKGRLFLRNIAMCFDRYLNQGKPDRNFSKTV